MYNLDQRDPIEGWKLASTHPCDFCSGRGHIDPSDERYNAVQVYTLALLNTQQAAKEKRAREELRRKELKKQALAKLTIEEIEALDV